MPFRNISMCFERNWANNPHWTIQDNCDQMRVYKTSCAILFGNDLEAGLHIIVLTFLNLQNAKEEKSLYQIGKICDLPFIRKIKS